MTILWLVSAVALIAALLAWRQARLATQRLEQVSQMYWELKFQHGEMRVLVERLAGGGDLRVPPSPPPDVTPPRESFVPLTSLKR